MATLIRPGSDASIDTSRFEMVDGQLQERPIPNTDHSGFSGACHILLRPPVKRIGHVVHQEWTLSRAEGSGQWMTPDVLVARQDASLASNGHVLPPCLLAIEVLSPSQTFPEMGAKALRYFEWGVQNVWVIDPETKSAMTMKCDAPHEGRMVFVEGVLHAGAEISLTLEEISAFE
jgi:Uma2 family endonuclease